MGRKRRTGLAVAIGSLLTAASVLVVGPALADHVTEPGSNEADCSYASEGGNVAVAESGVALYAGPNSSGPDPEGSNRVAAGVCTDDNDVYEGTNEVAVDLDTLYAHFASDGGEGNDEALFDGWFGIWTCGGGEFPTGHDGIHGNWHDDEAAPCQEHATPPGCDRASPNASEHAQRPRCAGEGAGTGNECPPEDLDPADNSFSLQTPVGASCYDLADLSCAHVWADVNDVFGIGPYVSFGNDHPDNEEGCADPSDEPDDGRSAHNGLCIGTERGPDSGAEAPVCANPGDTLDEFGISLGSELDECVRFVTGEPSNPDHGSIGVCVDDDGDGIPDPV